VSAGAASAQEDPQHPATCAGYIATMEAGARSGDPLAVQAYISRADQLYLAMNKGVVERRMVPLPLPADEDAEAQRAMVVVSVCQHDMSSKYTLAVANAYVMMRQAAGLSVDLHQK